MNYQDVIREMQRKYSGIRRSDDEWEATEKAIEALESMPEYEKLKERDVAKQVEIVKWGEEFDGALDDHRCPACKRHVDYHDSFCYECGQRIDWSEEEDHEN